MFDQLQAEAIDVIRSHKVWFVFAVDEDLGCTLLVACPETIESETLDGPMLYRILLSGVIGAAVESLHEAGPE